MTKEMGLKNWEHERKWQGVSTNRQDPKTKEIYKYQNENYKLDGTKMDVQVRTNRGKITIEWEGLSLIHI